MSTLTHQLIAHQVVFIKLKIRSSSLINSSRTTQKVKRETLLLPHIAYLYLYMPTMLPVVCKGFYTDVIFIRKANTNLFVQVKCLCKINHYLSHKTKNILSFVKLVVILLLSILFFFAFMTLIVNFIYRLWRIAQYLQAEDIVSKTNEE